MCCASPLRKPAAVFSKPAKAPVLGPELWLAVMQYTNIHARLGLRPDLNPELLRRIQDCRRRSRKARTHAEKIAMAARITPLSQPRP